MRRSETVRHEFTHKTRKGGGDEATGGGKKEGGGRENASGQQRGSKRQVRWKEEAKSGGGLRLVKGDGKTERS